MKLRWVVAIVVAAFAVLPAVAGSAPGQIAPGGKIAYMSKADGQGDIYSMTAFSSTVPVNLTHDKTIGVRTDVQPAWSPGGELVAFERQYTTGGANLMVVNADGTKLHALTTTMSSQVWNCHPSWLGSKLVIFTSNRDGNFDLYATPATGRWVLQLTHTKAPVQNLAPEVSRDGRYVVFSRTGVELSRKTAQLYLLGMDKGTVVQLTKNQRGQGDLDPVWSPDNNRIAFTSDRTGANNVWMVNADGTHLIQVTHTIPTPGAGLRPSSNVHPTFSPNGAWIAFVSTRTGATEIFVTRTPASTMPQPDVQLTFDRAFKANPRWQAFSLVP